ncbi:MAG: hypothetical protein WC612_07625 [Bdellovibrionales bacterium]|jgi:hypothetical protein
MVNTANNKNGQQSAASEKRKHGLHGLPPEIARSIKHHVLKKEFDRITKVIRREFKDDYQHIIDTIMNPHPETKGSTSLSAKKPVINTDPKQRISLSKTGEEGNLSIFKGSIISSGQKAAITVKVTEEQRKMLQGTMPMPKGRKMPLRRKKKLAVSFAANSL